MPLNLIYQCSNLRCSHKPGGEQLLFEDRSADETTCPVCHLPALPARLSVLRRKAYEAPVDVPETPVRARSDKWVRG